MPEEKTKYFVVKQKAVPEVLLKVVEAKKLLESERVLTVQEATDRVGISRSSFYKYKEDIFPFYDNTKGKTVTFVVQMDDEQGLLSDLLHIVAVYYAKVGKPGYKQVLPYILKQRLGFHIHARTLFNKNSLNAHAVFSVSPVRTLSHCSAG